MKPGKYVVAVSGGVDSMVLLHLLANYKLQTTNYQLFVAHINENLRPDSPLDQKLVKETAEKYGLEFYWADVKLANSSEALGRKVRYEYLNKLKKELGADAIITAHHQDDMLETAIINMLRGTGRRGLSSITSGKNLVRPLLKFTKKEIYDFAKKNRLDWREDYMNKDTQFLRNYIRHELLPKLGGDARAKLLKNIQNLGELNKAIDEELDEHVQNQKLDRQWFINLPHDVSNEILNHWLRRQNVNVERKKLNKLTIAAKTLSSGKQASVNKKAILLIEKDDLTLYNKSLYG